MTNPDAREGFDRTPVTVHRTFGAHSSTHVFHSCLSSLAFFPAHPSLMPGMFNIAQMKNRPMILIGG